MKKTLRFLSLALLVGVLAVGVVALVATPDASAARPSKVKCCDPALEPGTGGNPFCFEGHTCCSDGKWRCNNADGSPSCNPGQVCP